MKDRISKFHQRVGFFLPFMKLVLISLLVVACGGIVPSSERDPEVRSNTPGDLDQGVALNKSLSVTFSEEMSSETLTEKTFFLSEAGGPPVKGKIFMTGATVTFKATENNGLLKGGTTFVATVTTGVKDLSGNSIDQDHSWQFKTATVDSSGSTDRTPPKVVREAISPSDNARGVKFSPAPDIIVTFDKDINLTILQPGMFSLNHGVKVNLKPPLDQRTIIFTPKKDLDPRRSYTVTVLGGPGGVKDLAGNALASDFSWSFKTGSEMDND